MEKTILLTEFPDVPLLFGTQNRNIKLMSEMFGVSIIARDHLKVKGEPGSIEKIENIVESLQERLMAKSKISPAEVEKIITSFYGPPQESERHHKTTNRFPIEPRTLRQKQYMIAIREHDMVFAIGPAGTGKTYLAVAMAVEALQQNKVKRILLVRPAVEAGEKLGFLPGDFQAKINPYLRPLFDALSSLLDYAKMKKYSEKGIIEIAPLAYMRGRTLDKAFIILDEAQNTTSAQMKMFLTRMGNDSKVVVTGDITQVDLPSGEISGLAEAQRILGDIPEIAFIKLTAEDIVRHRLVQKIVNAYEKKNHFPSNNKS